MQDLQTQVSTGLRAQTYSGIAGDAQRLLGYEGEKDALSQFETDNDLMGVRLDATNTTLSGISDTVRSLRQQLLAASGKPLTADEASDLQEAAFRAIKDLQDHLNTDVDGRYLFSGSRVRSEPVDIPGSSLDDFQAIYDGSSVVYPPTRDAQVGNSGTLAPAGGFTMTGGDTIQAPAGTFDGVKAGATITLANSALGNDGTYTVVSVSSSQITISGNLSLGTTTIPVSGSVSNGSDTTAEITIGNYYQGDTSTQTHRLDDQRSMDLSLNAIDPAFEKAIRACGIIAQGKVGTSGGLENNDWRVDQALFLLNSAIDRSAPSSDPAFTASGAPEQSGSLDVVGMDVGNQQVMLSNAKDLHQQMIASLQSRIDSLQQADQTQSIEELMASSQSLEASYQVISRMSQLSLSKYL